MSIPLAPLASYMLVQIHKALWAKGIATVDGRMCRLYRAAFQKDIPTFMRDAEQDLGNVDRVIRVLRRFLIECDRQFGGRRKHPPLFQ